MSFGAIMCHHGPSGAHLAVSSSVSRSRPRRHLWMSWSCSLADEAVNVNWVPRTSSRIADDALTSEGRAACHHEPHTCTLGNRDARTASSCWSASLSTVTKN